MRRCAGGWRGLWGRVVIRIWTTEGRWKCGTATRNMTKPLASIVKAATTYGEERGEPVGSPLLASLPGARRSPHTASSSIALTPRV